MNTFNTHQESLMRRSSTQPTFYTHFFGALPSSSTSHRNRFDEGLVSTIVPSVTVVFEGRSICQRVCLSKHASYESLARALRQMFVDVNGDVGVLSDSDIDLSNAVPGHLIAYEDMEDDLLLAGDLSWKDFVRVAKRIRILPVKANHRKLHMV